MNFKSFFWLLEGGQIEENKQSSFCRIQVRAGSHLDQGGTMERERDEDKSHSYVELKAAL